MKLADMKIASGRALICICSANAPLSMADLKQAIAAKYEKEHDDITMRDAVAFLQNHGLVDVELCPTQKGRTALMVLEQYRETWAEKFFRPSNSPNVGPRASAPIVRPVMSRHAPNPGLSVGH